MTRCFSIMSIFSLVDWCNFSGFGKMMFTIHQSLLWPETTFLIKCREGGGREEVQGEGGRREEEIQGEGGGREGVINSVHFSECTSICYNNSLIMIYDNLISCGHHDTPCTWASVYMSRYNWYFFLLPQWWVIRL